MSSRLRALFAAVPLLFAVAGCSSTPEPAPDEHEVGGTLGGLVAGTRFELSNGEDALTLAGNGAFNFRRKLLPGSTYAVAVKNQPEGQTCTITRGSGTMGAEDVTDIVVTCIPSPWALGGTVTGLTGQQSVVVKNGADALTLTSPDVKFSFPHPVAYGSDFKVMVEADLPVRCTVEHGSGSMGAHAVDDVEVTCSTVVYPVGGTITGLTTGRRLSLRNGDEVLFLSANGPFQFANPIPDTGAYSVVVETPPLAESCEVMNGSGNVAHAPVTDVAVVCSEIPYTLGGTMTGLKGNIELEALSESLLVTGNGPFAFAQSLHHGDGYSVQVKTMPPSQTCTVQNADGTVDTGSVTDVTVECTDVPYYLSGNVSGLHGTVVLQLGAEQVTVTADGSFTFQHSLLDNTPYSVSVASNPAGQTCDVVTGTGTIHAMNAFVQVVCTPNPLVLRVGTGTSALSQDAAALFVDEYQGIPGAVVRSVPIPTTGSQRLTLGGVDALEGHLSLSGDGRFINFAGYDAASGTPAVNTTPVASVPRVVGQLDRSGNFSVAARLTDAYSLGSIRAATTLDGTGYWTSGMSGSTGELRYAPASASGTGSTVISNFSNDLRSVGVFGGNLTVLSNASGPNTTAVRGVLQFTPALPAAATPFNQLFLSTNWDGLAMVDTDSVPGPDVAYGTGPVAGAADRLLIQRVNLTRFGWAFDPFNLFTVILPSGTSSTTLQGHGIAALVTPVGVRVFVIGNPTASSPTWKLLTFLDDAVTTGWTVEAKVIAESPSNTAFRGVAVFPSP